MSKDLYHLYFITTRANQKQDNKYEENLNNARLEKFVY